MKRLLLLFVLMATGLFTNAVHAQLNVNINLDRQPDWGPKGHNYVESYYLPEYDMYYSVPAKRYYYRNGNRWLYSSAVPYSNVNLYRTHKVILADRYPYKKHKVHYNQFAKYRVGPPPRLIVANYNRPYRIAAPKKAHYKVAKIGHPPKGHPHFKKFKGGKHGKPHKGGPKHHR